ncbi:ABC transporter ATP-binding protein [Tistrella mobilis]|uniref:ABC transporter ATP-binding protein n=2 Tax=Tistrella mobilis TaxID=171437 RepID=UPI0032018C8A
MDAMTLEARHLTVSGLDRARLKDLCLSFGPGQLVGLIGPNGAGKTTLLRLLAGLLTPQHGSVLLGGQPLHQLSAAARARRISYLAQGADVHWPLPTEAVVALGRLPHGDGRRPSDRRAIARAMAATGTQGFTGRRVDRLSGGERLKVLLARALAVEAPILLADEPVAALDPAHQLDVMDLLKALAGDGRLVVAVLHDLGLAARFCDRLVLLAEGRLIADGSPEAVLTPDRLAQAYGIRALHGQADGHLLVVPWARTRLPEKSRETTTCLTHPSPHMRMQQAR